MLNKNLSPLMLQLQQRLQKAGMSNQKMFRVLTPSLVGYVVLFTETIYRFAHSDVAITYYPICSRYALSRERS